MVYPRRRHAHRRQFVVMHRKLHDRNAQTALRVLGAAKSRRETLLVDYVKRCSEAGSWTSCLVALNDATAHGTVVAEEAYALAVRCCGRSGRYREAAAVHQRAGTSSLCDHALMEAIRRNGKWRHAVSFTANHLASLNQRHAPVASTETMNNAIAAVIDAPAAWRLAIQLLRLYRQPQAIHCWHSQGSDVQVGGFANVPAHSLDSSTIDTLMTLLSRETRWYEAMSLLRAAQTQKVVITPTASDALIRCLHFSSRHVDAVAAIESALRQGAALKESTCVLALRSAEQAAEDGCGGSWLVACRILSSFQRQSIPLTRRVYESPLRTCCSNGRWREATKIAASMSTAGFTTSRNLHEMIVCTKASAASSYADALALIKSSSAANGVNSTRACNSLIEVAIQTKSFHKAYAVRSMMSKQQLRPDYRTFELRIILEARQRHWYPVLREFLAFKSQVDRDEAITRVAGTRSHGTAYAALKRVFAIVDHACHELPHEDPVVRSVREYMNREIPDSLVLA
jgi:hypothetical protein